MLKDITTDAGEEKRELEKWVNQKYGSIQNSPNDILLLLLYKIHLLEEKINRIEYQTKTHWVN
jgi:hypothetical protein